MDSSSVDRPPQPSLLVVGTGIEGGSHATCAAQNAIKLASKVLFAVADPKTVAWLRTLRPDAESLPYGTPDTPRRQIYEVMVERILAELRDGQRVCAAFYGNPAFLTRPAHLAIARARDRGFVARMLPGVSSLDCLFADLGFDPGDLGCQLYEATDFLLRPRTIDVHTPLLLMQIALVGNRHRYGAGREPAAARGPELLRDRLLALYPPGHTATVYLASTECDHPHRATSIPLSELASVPLAEASSLFIPQVSRAPAAPEILALLEQPSRP
jgi:precorrin-6B methylase 1